MMAGRRLIAGQQALGVELDMRTTIYAKLAAALVRLLRPAPDRPADEPRDRRPPGRSVLPRLRTRSSSSSTSFTIVGVGIFVFVISWKLALVSIAIVPVLIAVAYRYSHVSHPLLRDVQQKMADVATVAEENIVGVHVVKSFAQEHAEQEKFEQRSERVFDLSVQANRQRAFYIPILGFLPLLAQAAILLLGGRMVAHGSLLARELRPLQPLPRDARHAAAVARHVDRPGAAGDGVRRAHLPGDRRAGGDRATRPMRRELPAGPGRIVFEDVTFGYDAERPVLRDVDLELAAGRVVALIGHTGAGKTTLASLVPRFYDVQRGPRADRRRRRARRHARRRCAARSASSRRIRSSSRRRCARTSRSGAPDATDEEVERAARLAQAHEFVEALPDGYDTVIGERGITLSGGQRQRVAIARALVVDPRILILDDATASVDATTESKIRDGLREAMRDRTTIIIAHRLSTIALADEVVVLDDGRIAARGTHDDGRRLEQRLPRDRRARAARADLHARKWRDARAPAGQPPHARRAAGGRRLVVGAHEAPASRPLPARTPVQAAHRARDRLAARRDGRRARAAVPRRPHGRRGAATARPTRSAGSSSRSSRAGALGIAFTYAQTYFTGWTGERMLADLRGHLFRHLQRLSLGFYERNRAGVIISRLTNDVEALDQLVTDGVTSLVQNTLTLVGTAVVLFFLDWRLALATLTIMPGRSRLRRHGSASAPAARTAACARRSAPSQRRSPRTSPACACSSRSRASGRPTRTSVPGQRPLPRLEHADRRPERRLLPGRRLPLVGGDRGRARLRRLARVPRQMSRSARWSPSSAT